MVSFIVECIGIIILWLATDVGRKEDSKIKFLGRNWWFIFILLLIGLTIIEIGIKL